MKKSKGQSILVIDDNDDMVELQRTMLEIEGYDVFTAQSGEKALGALEEISPPDLILLDMQLGDMNGIEFLNTLEKKMPEIIEEVPIVFMTGADHVPPSRAVGFIQKPAEMEMFLSEINRYIGASSKKSKENEANL